MVDINGDDNPMHAIAVPASLIPTLSGDFISETKQEIITYVQDAARVLVQHGKQARDAGEMDDNSLTDEKIESTAIGYLSSELCKAIATAEQPDLCADMMHMIQLLMDTVDTVKSTSKKERERIYQAAHEVVLMTIYLLGRYSVKCTDKLMKALQDEEEEDN